MVNIYIESSVKGPKKTTGVVGFVLEEESHKDKTLTQFGKVTDATANKAVLLTLIYALKRIKTGTDVTIWSDNTYIQAAFEQGWLDSWVKNGWKTNKDKEPANSEEWKKMLEELGSVTPQFRTKEHHKFKKYLQAEVERRAKRYV